MTSYDELTAGEVETLNHVVINGPLYPGHIPSNEGLAGLMRKGLVVQILYRQDEGYYAASMAGRDCFVRKYSPTHDSITVAVTNFKVRLGHL